MISSTPETLSYLLADWLVDYVADVLTRQDRFTIALSGGSTPDKLYKLLATDAYRGRIDWSRWHVFWGDERAVPVSDDRNNARNAHQALLDHVSIPADQIHPFRTDMAPEQSVQEYESLLHTYFDGHPTTFDLVLLGMGDNAHTLSLFPGYAVVHEDHAWVSAFYLDEQRMYRLTLTAPVVNRAACVAFMITGTAKAEPLWQVMHGAYNPDVYPAQQIRPLNGNLLWFLDEAAAGLL